MKTRLTLSLERKRELEELGREHRKFKLLCTNILRYIEYNRSILSDSDQGENVRKWEREITERIEKMDEDESFIIDTKELADRFQNAFHEDFPQNEVPFFLFSSI